MSAATRRRALGLVMAGAALAAAFPVLTPAGGGIDWPRFLGPGVDSRSPETGLHLDWSEAPPPVLWHTGMGAGYASASVAGGHAFLFDRVEGRARLRCLKAETGAEVWSADYPTDYEDMYGFSNGPRAAPVVDGERVYTYGVEGRLRCHRVGDGSLVWEVDTAKEFGVIQNFFGVGSSPFVDGKRLIVMVGGSPTDSPGIQSGRVIPNGSAIVAFDKASGVVLYRGGDELASYSSPVVATVGGRRRGLAFARGGLLVFDPSTGATEFHFPWRATKLESVNASNPVIAGGLVFLSESYSPGSALLRFGEGKPELVWKDPPRGKAMRAHWMTPVLHEGTLYGSSGSGSGDAELRAVELATGKVHWSERGLGRCTILLLEDRLVVLTERGRLLVVQATPEEYRPLADVVIRGKLSDLPDAVAIPLIQHPAWTPPALSRGILYVRGKGRLVALDLRRPE